MKYFALLLGIIGLINFSFRTSIAQKPYKELITDNAVTKQGFFKVHRVGDQYYFEIPDSLMNRDIAVISRIVTSGVNHLANPFLADDLIGERIIRFSIGSDNKVFLKKGFYQERSGDSSQNGMYQSVSRSNKLAIEMVFDVLAYSPGHTGVVIAVTDLIKGDNELFFFDRFNRYNRAKPGGFQPDKSWVNKIQAFPGNIEVRATKTYTGASGNITYELSSSLLLLSKLPMKTRYFDDRIGYFCRNWIDFDIDPQEAKDVKVITKFRLEPRQEDLEKYTRGELVEPKKPIVFYIDPTIPKKWVPYIIKGVNDWQKAFEKAGFKRAIYAKEAPAKEEDSTWSLQDGRYNAIIWKPTTMDNANGEQILDPRSGEVIQARVNINHNEMKWNRDTYFILASPTYMPARKMQFDENFTGEIMRSFIAHEVGHTLGLAHNMNASATIPVEKLRDKKWVEENGFCPSIMDYARYNYIAQPEDSINESGLFRRIGVYDEWAIEWGYKWLPGLKTYREEKAYMNQWIISRVSQDKRLVFGGSGTEDVGDDAIKASSYGIKNLQRIVPNLIAWTTAPNKEYDNLQVMYEKLVNRYKEYLAHVQLYIGGMHTAYETAAEKDDKLVFIDRGRQKAAVRFLQEQLFITPAWLMNREIIMKKGIGYTFDLLSIQKETLKSLMDPSSRYVKGVLSFEAIWLERAYTFKELLNDLKKGIWSELSGKKPIDQYRRNVQMVYVRQLITVLQDDSKDTSRERTPEVITTIEQHAASLIADIKKALPAYKEEMTHLHLERAKLLLVKALENR